HQLTSTKIQSIRPNTNSTSYLSHQEYIAKQNKAKNPLKVVANMYNAASLPSDLLYLYQADELRIKDRSINHKVKSIRIRSVYHNYMSLPYHEVININGVILGEKSIQV